ncbi:insulinase family protein, partial [Porphyromonadaceae bacterium OttesenSCG-928-L07]|nr:insulinase family protein [Porphyromonadaceae bacterium OttesenSCG-928-L07]
AKKLVNTHFSKWAKGEAPKFKYNIPAQPKGNQVVFSNKNGANQASISVTYPIDFQKGQPDELAVEVMNQILGGGSFQAKLFKNLRETKGYTYGAYSSIYPDLLAGSARFSASSEVKAGVVDSALIEIFKEMNNMIEGNFSDEDLSRVKSTAAGDFSRSLESPNTVATFAYVIERYNLPADYFTTYLERLSKVSREDVIAAAKKYLHPNNAYVFVVTDRSQKEKLNKLASNGKVTEVENDGGPMKEGPKVAEGVTTETVVDAYLKAIGGKEKIANIKDMTLTSAMDMSGMSITTTTQYLTTPGKPAFKMEVSMGGNVIQKMVFDGTVAIVSGQRLEGENAAEIKKLAYPILEVEYLNLGAVLDGIEMVNGRNAYKLKVDNGKTTIYSFYDVENGLKVKDVNVAGDKIQEQLMEDYRETEVGILFPYVYKTTMMGMPIETKVSEIKFNTGLKIEDFK